MCIFFNSIPFVRIKLEKKKFIKSYTYHARSLRNIKVKASNYKVQQASHLSSLSLLGLQVQVGVLFFKLDKEVHKSSPSIEATTIKFLQCVLRCSSSRGS